MEWLINIADEAAEIKANREDKGRTRDLEVRNQTGGANEACSDWLHMRQRLSVLKLLSTSLEIFKSGSVRFWFDVSGETRETAAQVVTFKQPAQTFYK